MLGNQAAESSTCAPLSMATTASSYIEGRMSRIGTKLSFGVLKNVGNRSRHGSGDQFDLLSLTSGCSEEDAKITMSNRIKSRNDDGDNLRLLYEMEGGLFGLHNNNTTENRTAEYLNSTTQQLSVDRKQVNTIQQQDSMPVMESMDVDDYLWSQ